LLAVAPCARAAGSALGLADMHGGRLQVLDWAEAHDDQARRIAQAGQQLVKK
jgi:hypothetical protein